MNARLRLKLLRGTHSPHPPAPLTLLGRGLDAIIRRPCPPAYWLDRVFLLHDDKPLDQAITPAQRMDRYRTAAQLHPLHTDPVRTELRELIGAQFRASWQQGTYPRLSQVRRVLGPRPALSLVPCNHRVVTA